MSNTEPTPEILEPPASASVDQLATALAQNVNISSATDEETTSLTAPAPKLANEATSQNDSQVKTSIPVPDTKKPSTNTEFHLVKWIEFNCERLPILLQNINGPCPLLAIFNILLLRKRIRLNPQIQTISTQRVLALIAEHILDHDTSKLTEEDRINYEHNVQDALGVLNKLQTGLDVNLRFDGVDKFEYTGECIIFDLLNIQLYHGWVIDPQDTELRTIVDANASSYNQLVEKMIRQRHADREELLRESLLIEQFLDEYRSQLTHYGILRLNQTMRDNQLAVFFRNNHFSTIWKNQNQLLILVSDQGYVDHTSIVFETLTDLDNDSTFTDGYGRKWRKPEPSDASRDRELAIAMQTEEERLYQEAQLEQQQQQQQQQQHPRGRDQPHAAQSKKSKNKSKKPSYDDDQKESCNIS